MTWSAILGFRLVTQAPERLARFYEGLGFVVGKSAPISAEEMAVLGLPGGGERLSLTRGPSRLDLDRFDLPGAAYPADAGVADPVFQHLAFVTHDAAQGWDLARGLGAVPISRDGAVTLPATSGGVTTVKFRDPQGHPLEWLAFPAGSNPDWRGVAHPGIDHSAIAVRDVPASMAFYARAGLVARGTTLNMGPAQVALDGADDVEVEVIPLRPALRTPHLELLGYRWPVGRPCAPLRANDVAATRIVWAAGAEALVRDPDGHLHQLTL